MKPAISKSAPTQSGLMLFAQPLTPAPAPQRPALLSRIAAFFARPLGGSAAPLVTTEGGVAGSASPLVSSASRQNQVWNRRQMIADTWNLYYTNPRFRVAVEKHVYKVAGAGFRLKVEGRDGTSALQVRRARQEFESFLRCTGLLDRGGQPSKELMAKYLRHGRLEADLFLQHVIAWSEDKSSGDVVKLKVMPAASMERLTDDADEFLDPVRAFVQIDVNTQQVVPGGEFAAFQIGHHRWKQMGEDRYGSFEYGAARDILLSLANLEKFQEVRRKSNAARIEEHTLGEMGGGTTQKDIEEYGKRIGVRAEAAAVSVDPYDQLNKQIHDGNVSIKVHPGDPSVHEIADLTYFLETEGAALGTPLQLSGMNIANMSRDTLDLIVAEWLDGMAYDLAWVYGVILEAGCLQLELKGLSPEAFNITLDAPKRVFESAAEAIAFINKCMTNTLGAGMNAKPYPLLTAETAVEILAEYIGIADAEAYVEKLMQMMTETHTDPDTVHEMQQMGADPGVAGGAANSKNSAGGSSTGHGTKFEGGKLKPGVAGKAGGDGYKKKV